jgi:hypothetical protein
MAIKPEDVGDQIGREPSATFEVARGTDTEDVQADPESVAFGRHSRGPLVMLNYNKYHAFLPPWHSLVSFTLDGDATAVFGMPEYKGQAITGDLKTVNIVSPTVSIR